MHKVMPMALALALGAGCDELCEECDDGICELSDDCIPEGDLLYPLVEGAWWRYSVPEIDGVPQVGKVVSIMARDGIRPLWFDEDEKDFVVPGRDLARAYVAISIDGNRRAHRWQSIDPQTNDVLRHVDAWFDADYVGAHIEHYCPFKLRVADGARGTCRNSCFEERFTTTDITVVSGDWRECWKVAVNPVDCSVTDVPEGCSVATFETVRGSRIRLDHETNGETCADERAVAATFTTVEDGGEPDKSTYWWVRGVGKIRETGDGDPEERLIESCIPPACTRPAPEPTPAPHNRCP